MTTVVFKMSKTDSFNIFYSSYFVPFQRVQNSKAPQIFSNLSSFSSNRLVISAVAKKNPTQSIFHIGFLWSWRGSNPRPNRGYRRFLHAYSSLDCRVSPRPGPPSGTLASKDFARAARQTLTSPDLPAPPVPQSRNKDLGVMSCQPTLSAD